jgi:hypothetical protein
MLGTQRRNWLMENQAGDPEPAAPDHIATLLELAKLLKSPDGVRKQIAELADAATASNKATEVARTEQRKVEEAHAALAVEKQKHAAALAADRDRHEKQCRARETAVDAREKRVEEQHKAAEADRAKAAAIRADYERREKAWNAA